MRYKVVLGFAHQLLLLAKIHNLAISCVPQQSIGRQLYHETYSEIFDAETPTMPLGETSLVEKFIPQHPPQPLHLAETHPCY